MSRHQIGRIGAVSLLSVCFACSAAQADPMTQPATQPTTRPAPAALSDHAKNGLAWLAKHQLKDGSWGQGEESSEMGTGMAKIKDTPNVADTCMAMMALYHAGSTPVAGEYHQNIVSAVDFICGQIEASDDKSLSITSLNGTRTQVKLGPNIDTFMAAQALAELKGKMADATSNQRVEKALKKVLHKMELNQKDNGLWADGGWAPTLAQAQASKAANLAVQQGATFDEGKRMNAQAYARADFYDKAPFINGERTGGFPTGGAGGSRSAAEKATESADKSSLDSEAALAGSAAPHAVGGRLGPATHPAYIEGHFAGNAGVPLYSAAADIAAMQASANTNHQNAGQNSADAASPSTQPEFRARARHEIAAMNANDKELATAQDMVLKRMDDPQFANGFGSDGGEEYLSYLNIGESLYQRGGGDWTKWSKTMADNLDRIQNDDGSWSGGHCITGRTFCTAAAIQVLVIDRSPIVKLPAVPTTRPAEPTTRPATK